MMPALSIAPAGLDLAELERLLSQPSPFAPHLAPFWDDPHIGQSMLAAHLDPEREAASRPHARIDREVAWILNHLDLAPGAPVLDLGCGPGLYCTRLARHGMRVTGVDFSPVALEHARKQAERDGAVIDYLLADYRVLDLVEAFDAAVLIYYDFGVLADGERDEVLRRVARSLRPGGWLVFDMLSPGALGRRAGQRIWSLCPGGGFWRAGAYLALTASYHYPALDAEVDQTVVLETSGQMRLYRIWNRGYTPESLAPVLDRLGFRIVGVWGDLEGALYGSTDGLGVVARLK
jgi:SAM-dependent methyltransferase